jgi:hypothetical protein
VVYKLENEGFSREKGDGRWIEIGERFNFDREES